MRLNREAQDKWYKKRRLKEESLTGLTGDEKKGGKMLRSVEEDKEESWEDKGKDGCDLSHDQK